MATVPQLIGDLRFCEKSVFGGKLTVFEARPGSALSETAGHWHLKNFY
jgi:hypothetical protein